MKRLTLQTLIVLLCAAARAQQSPTPKSQPVVYVRVWVPDALYDDDPSSLREFQGLLARARVREVEKAPGESINEVIAREYQFGHTRTPLTYKLIEDAVKRLNVTTRSDKLLVPDIAPRSWEDFNPKKAANSIPKIATWDLSQVSLISGETVFHGRPRIIDSGRKAAQSMVIEYPVTEVQARTWKADPAFDGQVLNLPITARLATDGNTGGSAYHALTDAQAAFVRTALATAQRDSYVVVADSGWPGNDEYKRSLKLLEHAIDVVRAERLNLGSEALPMPQDLPSAPGNKHCVAIRDALRELEALDPAARVKVIYLPLTREQGAGPLLESLIATEYLVDLRLANPHIVKPDEKEVAQAKSFAKNVVGQLPTSWPADQQQVITDKAILEAVMRIMNWFALSKSGDLTVFLNESWTAKHEEYFVAFPSPMRGAIVAATGNDNEKVNVDLWEFAQRCINNRDTIAVMNYDGSGPICNTGSIDPSLVSSALAVGFDGRVESDCTGGGTSISAPRVAWLLAAGETVRVKPFNASHWGIDALSALTAIRSDASLKGLRFDPVKYIGDAMKP